MADTLHRTTRAEREAFLRGVHIAIVSVDDPGHPPQSSPIWYLVTTEGNVELHVAPDSRKLQLIKAAGAFTLCVQSEQRPPAYVTVQGPVIGYRPRDLEADARPLCHRYLGKEAGDQLLASAMEGDEAVVITMKPERWYGLDYGKS